MSNFIMTTAFKHSWWKEDLKYYPLFYKLVSLTPSASQYCPQCLDRGWGLRFPIPAPLQESMIMMKAYIYSSLTMTFVLLHFHAFWNDTKTQSICQKIQFVCKTLQFDSNNASLCNYNN